MKKYFFAGVGFLALSIGFVDWLAGALVPHTWLIVGVGVAAWIATWFSYSQEKSRKPKILPLPVALIVAIFGTVDTCAAGIHDVLIPPDKWPILQWNPNAVSGLGAWGCALLFIACSAIAYAILWYFFRGCFQRPQKKVIALRANKANRDYIPENLVILGFCGLCAATLFFRWVYGIWPI